MFIKFVNKKFILNYSNEKIRFFNLTKSHFQNKKRIAVCWSPSVERYSAVLRIELVGEYALEMIRAHKQKKQQNSNAMCENAETVPNSHMENRMSRVNCLQYPAECKSDGWKCN